MILSYKAITHVRPYLRILVKSIIKRNFDTTFSKSFSLANVSIRGLLLKRCDITRFTTHSSDTLFDRNDASIFCISFNQVYFPLILVFAVMYINKGQPQVTRSHVAMNRLV